MARGEEGKGALREVRVGAKITTTPIGAIIGTDLSFFSNMFLLSSRTSKKKRKKKKGKGDH